MLNVVTCLLCILGWPLFSKATTRIYEVQHMYFVQYYITDNEQFTL